MNKINENTNPLTLAWPIFIEVLLFMVMGNIDTIMLSRFSENAVAAVGNANQLLNTLLILFNITSAATGIMVAQYLGASSKNKLNQIYNLAYTMNLGIALIISIAFAIFRTSIFGWIHLPVELYSDTSAYLNTTLSFLFIPALFVVSSTILKSNGQTKLSMYLAMGMNVLNVIGNYVFLFGPFGIPVLGVKGVALSTVISRLIALLIMLYALYKHYEVRLKVSILKSIDKKILKQFLQLGLPSAGEPISWQFSQMVIFTFINLMGSSVVTTKVYVQIIVWFTFLGTLALAQANQIIVGHLIGAGKEDAAFNMTKVTLKRSLIITIITSALFVVFRIHLLSLFTQQKEIIQLGAMILVVDFFVEVGRAFNLVIINAFKAAGDVKFPVYMGIFSMWLISTLGAYVLGIHWGFGLVGVWIAMAADELFRGIVMYRRLINGNWRGKGIVRE